MGHIVIADPNIRRFRLHHRLRLDLLRRGHRVSILCTERSRFTFWREQVADVDLLEPSSRDEYPDAIREILEEIEPQAERRQARKIATAMHHWFARELPDLVLLHEDRSAISTCIQLTAHVTGCRVLWSGEGLLPHTIQIDESGLDADASHRKWSAKDFRCVTPNQNLLDASLADVLAGGIPLTLPMAPVNMPPLRRRIADAICYMMGGRLHAAMSAIHRWRLSFTSDDIDLGPTPILDWKAPFVTVLLQHPNDTRVVRDAIDPPNARTLVQRAVVAADLFGPQTKVLVVLPGLFSENQGIAHAIASEHGDRIRITPSRNAALAASAAATVITINHPLATVALLTGTPVVILGRALYELDGVTTTSSLEELPDAVRQANQSDRPALRRRFLTWLLQHGHCWCSTTSPNHNGMHGLIRRIESQLDADLDLSNQPLSYRPGPSWPLTTR